jgi:hypothetical protein
MLIGGQKARVHWVGKTLDELRNKTLLRFLRCLKQPWSAYLPDHFKKILLRKWDLEGMIDIHPNLKF